MEGAQHLPRIDQQRLPGIGQRDPAPDALEQGEAALRLDLLDLEGDPGGRQMQPLGDAGERQRLGGLDEDLELANRDVPHCRVSSGS